MSTQIQTLSEARGAVERARAQIKTLKKEGQRVTRLATHSTLMAAGGAAAGVIKRKMPKVFGVDSHIALGVALTGASALDFAGDFGDELNAIGGGMLAKAAGDYAELHIK